MDTNTQTTASLPSFTNKGCGCAYCQNGQEHAAFSDSSVLLKDLAVLPGGGGTVTPASIGINNASELIHGFEWGPGGGTGVSLTYSFLTEVPDYYAPASLEQTNFLPFSTEMQSAVRSVLSHISTFANITFTEVNGFGDLTYGQAYLTTATSDPLAYAYYPDQGGHSGDVWFNDRYNFDPAMDAGEVGYFIALHETGHALGLEHSFSVGLTGTEDSEQYTVMSYDLSPWGNTISAQTYMLYDIAAIQAIYGANTSYNSGDTNYILDPNAAYTIWDGGGIDTLDSSALSSDVIIHLEEGGFSSVGLSENIAIAYGTVIENAITGSGDDFIYGNATDNVLNGGAGDDTLEGGDGNDTYFYSAGVDIITETNGIDGVEFDAIWHPSDVSIVGDIITLASNINQLIFNDISLIEFFYFDGFADMNLNELLNFGVATDDIFIGTTASETFDGGDGTDTVDYSASVDAVNIDLLNNVIGGGDAEGDTLISIENIIGSDNASERDWVWGDAQDNHIQGMAGHDILEGGAGADIIDGGAGWDYSRYTGSSSAININLETGINTGGDAEGDVLIGIEAVVGSAHNDTIIGGASNDYIRGENGNDTLNGGTGADQLYGGNGADIYIYTSGRDRVTETGSDSDRVIFDARWSLDDLTITGNQFIFNQGVDTLTFNDLNLIELFSFDGFTDMSFGDIQAYLNSLSSNETGTNNDDFFIGTQNAQNFDGLNGTDTVDYSASVDAVNIDLLNNVIGGGDAEGDTLISIENIIGSDNASARDWVWGDAQDNHIQGMAGHDILEGGAGADIIDGGAGWDYSRYTGSSSAININLETGINTGGDAEGDVLIGIEAVVGSAHNDTIIGGASNDYIRGENGNDTLNGGAGADQLYGGNGADIFLFEALSAFDRVDDVRDLDLSEGDAIDISDLLVNYDALADAISDFVQITDSGVHSVLAVDVNGGADNFVSIATLHNVTGLSDEEALETSGTLITT